MFCNKCGKEISAQAKFCNHCGNPINAAQPADSAPAGRPVQKKGKAGRILLSAAVAVAVYFGAKTLTQSALTPKNSAAPQSSASTISTGTSGNKSLTAPCFYGGLYENGYFTYGAARVYAPGYSLLDGGGGQDYLCTADRSTLLYAGRRLEVGIAYDSSDAQGILDSYGSSMTNCKMVDFRKYEVGGYPVIRYIMSCTVDGMDEYIGEMIVCPDKNPGETLRLCMETLADNGYGELDRVFDTLDISASYVLNAGDTQSMGLNQITAK